MTILRNTDHGNMNVGQKCFPFFLRHRERHRRPPGRHASPANARLLGATFTGLLHGDRSPPDNMGLDRQYDGIVGTVPTKQSLELAIELLSASGPEPGTREAVSGMEGLD